MRRATTPSPLARAASEPAVRYEYQGQTFTLDDYLARNPATGLLVARGDTILIERYQYARHDRHRFTSWSMAKTVTAMLIGIAIAEGHIRSVDDPAAAYVPALADTEYGRTSLRHLLQMSSGVRFVEEYSGKDDVARLAADTFRQVGAGGVEAVTPFNVRAHRPVPGSTTPPSRPSARSSCSAMRLAGRSPTTCRRRSGSRWGPKPTRPGSSTARPGGNLLLPQRGAARLCTPGTAARPRRELARPADHSLRPGSRRPRVCAQASRSPVPAATAIRSGYCRASGGCSRSCGIRGQAIFVDPASRLVMVHTAVRKQARDPGVIPNTPSVGKLADQSPCWCIMGRWSAPRRSIACSGGGGIHADAHHPDPGTVEHHRGRPT